MDGTCVDSEGSSLSCFCSILIDCDSELSLATVQVVEASLLESFILPINGSRGGTGGGGTRWPVVPSGSERGTPLDTDELTVCVPETGSER